MSPAPPARLELAAAAIVPASAFGFVRVFGEQDAVLPLIGASLLSTALAVAARRLRLPLVVSIAVSLAALSILVISRYAPGTSTFGFIPTGESITALRQLVDDGLLQFRELRAPVEPLDPFIAAAMIAAWLMAFLTDWGALRLRLAFEPVLPGALLFIFSAVLGSGERRLISTLVFAIAVAAWAITQRVTDLAHNSVWLNADRQRGPLDLARNASLFGVGALLVGALVGPLLPGAEAEEIYTWRNKGDPVRTVVSPYVSIQNRLVTQQSTRLFTVTSDRPAYWRLAGLDKYEDGFWSTRATFEEEDGDLPGLKPSAGTTVTVRQTFKIESLEAIWLPAAFAPSRVIGSEGPVTWNSDTSSLTVDSSRPTSDGLEYTVDSVLPMYTAEELRAAPTEVPPSIAEQYLSLPDDITPRLGSEAEAITAGATTNYDRMLALQEHFRTFDYSIRLGPREGDPIEQFLNERIGFCQQFSGTFALMARHLGVPARVAVGFTWGDPVDGQPGVYAVSGRQTHAWPEVWFSGLGWVSFEPTPGRGQPDALYNTIEPQQDSLIQPDQPGQETTTTEGPNGLAGPAGQDLDFDPALGLGDDLVAGDVVSSESGFSISSRWIAAITLLVVYALGLPAWHRLRRARRAQRATTGSERIEVAWADAAEALERLGLIRPSTSTRREWTEKLASEMRLPSDSILSLGNAATVARYAPVVPESTVTAAETAAAEIRTVVYERESWWRNWLTDLDPRRLLQPTKRRLLAGT